eukprot:COSAG05_NODE_6238_length_993_cov_49.921700_2_plen_38_part_01
MVSHPRTEEGAKLPGAVVGVGGSPRFQRGGLLARERGA